MGKAFANVRFQVEKVRGSIELSHDLLQEIAMSVCHAVLACKK